MFKLIRKAFSKSTIKSKPIEVINMQEIYFKLRMSPMLNELANALNKPN